MEKKDRKYLSVGSIISMTSKKGEDYKMITLDNLALSDFVELLQEHGKRYLAGKTEDEIKAGQKEGTIPRIQVSMFEPGEKAPDLIFKNLAIKVR